MLKLPSLTRKLMIGGLAAATVAGSLAVSTASADAGWRGHRWHGHHHRHGGAWIAPAIVGGLALGALAAPYAYGGPVYYGERCWIERRHAINRWGQPVVRRIQVCG